VQRLQYWLGKRAAFGGRTFGYRSRKDDPLAQEYARLSSADRLDAESAPFILGWIVIGWSLADIAATVLVFVTLIVTQAQPAGDLGLSARIVYGLLGAIYLFHVAIWVRYRLAQHAWNLSWVPRIAQPKNGDILLLLGLAPVAYALTPLVI
jgi:hypothetical protein